MTTEEDVTRVTLGLTVRPMGGEGQAYPESLR